jgi:hemerythrin superfamily protein
MEAKTDVIEEVLKDHNEIKELFTRVEQSIGDQKREAFEELVRKLAVHETAEQEVVHPLARKAEASDVVEERLTEEKEGERALSELVKMGVEAPEFKDMFEQLKADVLFHASKEETDEHPKIRSGVKAAQLEKLAAIYRAAEATAPTRPHPSGPTSAAGNLAVGPVVAIMDRARDAVRDAMQKLSA